MADLFTFFCFLGFCVFLLLLFAFGEFFIFYLLLKEKGLFVSFCISIQNGVIIYSKASLNKRTLFFFFNKYENEMTFNIMKCFLM